jgi:hypothetical protein
MKKLVLEAVIRECVWNYIESAFETISRVCCYPLRQCRIKVLNMRICNTKRSVNFAMGVEPSWFQRSLMKVQTGKADNIDGDSRLASLWFMPSIASSQLQMVNIATHARHTKCCKATACLQLEKRIL